MDPTLAKMLDLRFFHEHGWERKTCPTCKDPFWTLDPERTLCGDSTCEEYQFLGDPLTDAPLSLSEMREAFLSFWEGKKHTRVPRNPVVARWRDDIYLNIASIANYQPHVTSGEVPPPANPLVVSQPCIRLNDLANIGRSGRHFACFEMMGHHSFNSKEWGQHYWTEECVEWGQEFLTKSLGLDGARITYKEATWSGGGNAGPCLEVFAAGLEVATLVFMCLEECEPEDVPEGEASYQVKDATYRMMDLRIIDTGWGLERLAWASTGTPTAYDTVFPEAIAMIRDKATVTIADDARSRQLVTEHARVQGVLNLDVGTKLDKLRQEVVERMAAAGIETTVEELERVMDPIESMYALADHLRCLSFMVGDGIVPGNVKAGYLMRLMFRRALRLKDRLGIEDSLADLLVWNMEGMVEQFPEFAERMEHAREMTELETQRAHESKERGLRLVERMLKKKQTLDVDDLVELYDTHGLGPNTVAEAAAGLGVTVEVPDTFDMIVAERHGSHKKAKAKASPVPDDVPDTQLIFYDDQDCQEFDAKVLWSGTQREGDEDVHLLVLDRTAFFWETGGQPADRGTLTSDDGVIQVLGMRKEGDHAVHVVDQHLAAGTNLGGVVDWDLRMDHTRSHTATHIMNQAVRRVLGQHSWQAGTQKYPDCARVDMTHYRRPTRDELDAIEHLANRIVMEGRKVTRTWYTRGEAESKYGLTLLQGGIPKGDKVRVVAIAGREDDDEPWDVEYCGGTHCARTHSVGPIKLWRTERIQDGVERFEYSAGRHAVDRWQGTEATLREGAEAMGVAPAEVPQAARRFFEEWKERGKLLDELQNQLAQMKAASASDDAEEVAGVRMIVDDSVDAGALKQTAVELLAEPNTVVLLGAAAGPSVRLIFARSAEVDVDMGAVLREFAPICGGKGGGRPDFAQGGGSDPDKLRECLDAAAGSVKASLAG